MSILRDKYRFSPVDEKARPIHVRLEEIMSIFYNDAKSISKYRITHPLHRNGKYEIEVTYSKTADGRTPFRTKVFLDAMDIQQSTDEELLDFLIRGSNTEFERKYIEKPYDYFVGAYITPPEEIARN